MPNSPGNIPYISKIDRFIGKGFYRERMHVMDNGGNKAEDKIKLKNHSRCFTLSHAVFKAG